MPATHLNYHHLQYFWAVASDGNLTRTAQRLRVAQSSLSAQIRALEAELDVQLFEREGRRLTLTEAGQVVLAHADEIFRKGGELLATLDAGRPRDQPLRIGAVATLSRNFQEGFVRPLLSPAATHQAPRPADVRLDLVSGTLEDLLGRLAAHAVDLVLSNRPVKRSPERPFRCRRIARQRVSLVGRPREAPLVWPDDLAREPMLLPGPDSEIRTAFDALCEQLDLRPRVLAEVDDMAMMRLLARDTDAIALIPSVVVRDELHAGLLEEYREVPEVFETFYAITADRQFPHPLVRTLLARHEADILGVAAERA